MSDCQHEDFRVDADVHRLQRGEGGEVHAYMLDIKLKCTQCNTSFTFPSFPNGISSHEARVSVSGEVLSVPVKPQDQEHFNFFPGFDVKHTA